MNPRFVPRIDQPCPLKWESMQGDDRKRFCSVCQLYVHDLSAMSAEERTQLLSRTDRKCVTYLKTPELVKIDIRRWQFLDRIFTALRPALAGLIGCMPFFAANANQPLITEASATATPKPSPSPTPKATPEMPGRTLGVICVPTPSATPKPSANGKTGH